MNDNEPSPEMEERWQNYLKSRRRGKYLVMIGMLVIIGSLFLAIIPVSVAAFTGTVYVGTPWSDYIGISIIFGIVLIIGGIISRISPNMMEGNALWVFKVGFDSK